MALTKISRGLLNTGVSDSSDATFLTVDSSENATLAGNLTVSGNLTVTGTSTQVDTVTMNAQNAVIFEGATADNYETTLTIVDPTADRTQYLINQTGYVPLLAALTTTAITSTPAELNLLDGVSGGTVAANLAVVVDGNKDIGSFRNVTLTGELDAGSLDISGNADIDGTLEADAITIDGVTLSETIADTVGAMVGSNTESGITVAYQDGDNTLDFTVGTLNQNTSGLAGTATALATARTIGGVSFDGTANIAVTLAATATALASARTIGGVSFDGTANIVPGTATALATGRTIGGVSFDGTANIVPGTITIADESSDTTCFPLFVTAATGDLAPKSGSNLAFNSSTGALTATSFVGAVTGNITGDLTGNVTGNASGTALTVTQAAQTAITSLGTLTGLTVNGAAVFNENSADVDFRIESNGTTHMFFVDGGNDKIGIGTDSPGRKLHVNDSLRIAAGEALEFGGNSNTIQNSGNDIFIKLATNEKFRFTNDGEIGIAGTNYGTDGQVLTSGGAGAGVAWEDAGGGGASDIDGLSDAKSGGANFTSSLILGHQTTGTLSSAHYNTAVGYGAMDAITQGDENVAVGYGALGAITTGVSSVGIGSGAGGGLVTSGSTVAVGQDAFRHGTGGYNTFVGNAAGADASNTAANNVGVGYQALYANTSGTGNTAIGRKALFDNETHSWNTAVGYNAAYNNVGTGNTVIGYQALTYNEGGGNNVAIGYQACLGTADVNGGANSVWIGSGSGLAVSTAQDNVGIGYLTGDSITSGGYNVLIGVRAGQALTTNGSCTLVGFDAGKNITAPNTVAIGNGCLDSLVSGTQNVAVGNNAGGLTTGSSNTLMGFAVMDSGLAVSNNTAMGANALGALVYGNGGNTCIGFEAGSRLTGTDGAGDNGSYNTFVGYGAGKGTTQQRCTAIGYGSGAHPTEQGGWYRTDIGMYAGNANYGSQNVSIGYGANQTGAGGYNICIGMNSSTGGGGNNTNNAIILGTDGLTASTNSRVSIGTSSAHIYASYTSGTWSASSDVNMKKDIATDTLGLSFINDLRPVTFKYKAPSEYPTDWDSYSPPTYTKEPEEEGGTGVVVEQKTDPIYDGTVHGLIAQEVKAALDTAGVDTFAGWDELSDGKQTISKSEFVIPLIKAVQELSDKLDATANISDLEQRIHDIEQRLV